MFCPKCATQNIDGARFCRACGADVSLVPMAMSGNLPQAQPAPQMIESSRRGRRRNRVPTYESAFSNLGMGIAFAVISLMVLRFAPGGQVWWFWMLIPAFMMAFRGIGEFARLRNEPKALPNASTPTQPPAMAPAPARVEFAPYNTSELMPPPPSVTEGTTRHLAQEGPTRVFEVRAERPKQEP